MGKSPLSAMGGDLGQLAQRAPTRGPRQARPQRRFWRPATVLPGPCRHSVLHCGRQHAPPPAGTNSGGGSSEGRRRTESPDLDELSDKRLRVSVPAPSDFHSKDEEALAPRCNSGYVARLRLSAMRRKAMPGVWSARG